MNVAEKALRQMNECWVQLGRPMPIDQFVAEHGIPFSQVRPHSEMGVPKECFCNAARLVVHNSSLTYVEGYAANHEFCFPFLHAWVVNPDGIAFDPTIPDVENYDYFGVAFKHEFVLTQMVKYAVWGILGGDPRQARELILNTPEEVWKHE